jgi:hypothetical protein
MTGALTSGRTGTQLRSNNTVGTLLNRDQVFAANDVKTEDVECPEWGGTMRVRGLTGKERGQLERMFSSAKKGSGALDMGTDKNGPDWGSWRAWLVSRAAVDENGKPVFSVTDIQKLGERSAAPIDRVSAAIMALSGIGATDQEEMEKNSEGTTTEGSSSE